MDRRRAPNGIGHLMILYKQSDQFNMVTDFQDGRHGLQ